MNKLSNKEMKRSISQAESSKDVTSKQSSLLANFYKFCLQLEITISRKKLRGIYLMLYQLLQIFLLDNCFNVILPPYEIIDFDILNQFKSFSGY